VLLIDGDIRHPRLHEVFSLQNKGGLSELLSESDPTNTFKPVETEIPGLHFLPAGGYRPETKNLLYSPRMARLLQLWREQYDFILIDTAPVLPIRDARLFGRLSDGVILVARANKTSPETLVAAAARFREDGTPLLGTILNDWNPKGSSTGYGTAYWNVYSNYFSG